MSLLHALLAAAAIVGLVAMVEQRAALRTRRTVRVLGRGPFRPRYALVRYHTASGVGALIWVSWEPDLLHVLLPRTRRLRLRRRSSGVIPPESLWTPPAKAVRHG